MSISSFQRSLTVFEKDVIAHVIAFLESNTKRNTLTLLRNVHDSLEKNLNDTKDITP